MTGQPPKLLELSKLEVLSVLHGLPVDGYRQTVWLLCPKHDASFKTILLGDKMNLTVRLGKQFYVSSSGVPALLPCSQLSMQARGTLRKMFT